jgi:hypothetical protein
MTDKRLLLALPTLALLAACGGNAPASDDSRAASGEVLEGTISDGMLPVDRVRSEPPLEDPEAFARARSATDGAASADAAAEGAGTEGEQPAAEATPDAAPEAEPPAADE